MDGFTFVALAVPIDREPDELLIFAFEFLKHMCVERRGACTGINLCGYVQKA